MRTITLTLALILFASPVLACDADAVPDTTNDFGGAALNDFARIMRSAQVAGCANAAARKLSTKLDGITATKWQSTWSGGALSMALATGLILGPKGELTPELDKKLAKAANDYRLVMQTNPQCGFSGTTWTNGNTCLEDWAIGAWAHGWRTAYYRLTGRDWFSVRSSTVTAMRTTLNDQINCIVDPDLAPVLSSRGPCQGNPEQLGDGFTWDGLPQNAYVVTLNHGVQNPAYGVGQMTAIAAAAVGLEVAKEPFRSAEFHTTQRSIAMFLFREGNDKARSDGRFANNCVELITSNGTFTLPDRGCWDTQKGAEANGYRADMFPVAAFYSAYGLSMNLNGAPVNWAYSSFNPAPFSNPVAFFGAGRYESYYTMANRWLNSVGFRPVMYGRPEYVCGIKRLSNYVYNTGTGTPAATATSRTVAADGTATPEVTYTLIDINGGMLLDGDQVAIRNKDGWYWQATNGGGSTIFSNAASITTNARFTIGKVSPDHGDPIAHNDLFVLRTANGVHYVVAPAGGALSATSTSVITDEQFRLERFRNE